MASGTYVGSELELFAHARNWKGYWGSLIRPYLGRHILDVGAGIGETAHSLADTTQQKWVCLEPDPALVARMAQRIASSELPGICETYVGTIDDIDANDFTAVVYIDVLEHIEDDRLELGKAAARISAGGRLIVLVPAHQWLYSPFDKSIGHFRRYTLAQLRLLTPPDLSVERGMYLDCVGLFASLANRFMLKSKMPTTGQIAVWDRVMVPLSRWIDPVFGRRFGKTAVMIWKKH